MLAALVLASEGGHEPNGVILPSDFNEVIWGSIAFFIVFGLLVWKGGPAIKKMWNARIERIANEVNDAANARAEAEARLAEVRSRIANVEQERQGIRAEATRTAQALSQQIAARTESDVAEIGVRAQGDAQASRAQVTADLQSEIADLAVGAAEQIVVNSLDRATRDQLIESYIAKVGQAS